MNLNARQSVALLSNNRKYLKKICINGYIFDFQMIKNWLQDFELNKEAISEAKHDLLIYNKIKNNIDYIKKLLVNNFIFCDTSYQIR